MLCNILISLSLHFNSLVWVRHAAAGIAEPGLPPKTIHSQANTRKAIRGCISESKKDPCCACHQEQQAENRLGRQLHTERCSTWLLGGKVWGRPYDNFPKSSFFFIAL
jgi:hypothetical protein